MREPSRRPMEILIASALLALSMGQPVSAAGGPAAATLSAGQRTTLPGVVILKLRQRLPDGASKTGVAAADAWLESQGFRGLSPIARGDMGPRKPGGTDLSRIYRARYGSGAPPEVVAQRLSTLPEVEYAEPQYVYPLDVVPNDPSYPSQQSYLAPKVRFPEAWDLTRGELGGVVVAIVDGGTNWQHQDLAANVWTNSGEIPGNGLDDDHNGFVDDLHGWNFANDTNDPTGLPATANNATHGTHTAGIVCAVANNSVGIAGASWNSKFMPVCTGSPTTDNAIAFGYDGILYAARNGANIINCSWGGLGSPSNFELEVIRFAWEHGAAVVAAAGNLRSPLPHYPSAYPHVLSVVSVNSSDVKNVDSNYGTTVDVCAPGVNVLSTIPPELNSGFSYGYMTGTSMASPHAAAVCALVKTRWPGYTPDQVMERVRVTSNSVDNINYSYRGLMGFGRINALQALTKSSPAIRVTHMQIVETDGDGIIEPGETVTLHLTVTNFLAACTNAVFNLRETSTYAAVADSVAQVAALDSMQSVQLPPLSLQILPSAPIQHVVSCILAVQTGAPAYTDKDRFDLIVQPVFITHDANNVQCSVTSVGRLGFAMSAGGNGSDGIGFQFKNGPNLLYEGSLLMGVSPARISDTARRTADAYDQDFATVPGGVPHKNVPGLLASEQSTAAFNDSVSTASPRLAVRVRQDGFEYTAAPHDNYIILRYTIRNAGGAALSGLRVGWFLDWDIDGGTFATNSTAYDASRGLGYVWDTSGRGPTTYVGVKALGSLGTTSFRGIWNAGPDLEPRNPSWGVYDGYTDGEKWESLSGGFVQTAAGPADISMAIATGPFDVAPGDSIVVGFAFLGGDNLADLQASAESAALKWTHIQSGLPVDLFDFTAEQDAGDVLLRWRTGHEKDVASFRVFRARDGDPFEALEPDLEPSPEHRYTFRDPNPELGRYAYRVGEVSHAGEVVLHGLAEIDVAPARPRQTFLDPAVPNPFNPTTTLRFGLAQAGPAELVLYDARGRRVRALLQSARLDAGYHQLVWDGRDDRGQQVASGIYHARLVAGAASITRRLVLLK